MDWYHLWWDRYTYCPSKLLAIPIFYAEDMLGMWEFWVAVWGLSAIPTFLLNVWRCSILKVDIQTFGEIIWPLCLMGPIGIIFALIGVIIAPHERWDRD